MNLKIKTIISLKINANSATTGTPVGPILGQYGIPAGPFCKSFNDQTFNYKKDVNLIVIIKLYNDNSYMLNIKLPSLSFLLLRASNSSILFFNNMYKKNKLQYYLDTFEGKHQISKELKLLTVYQLYEVINYIVYKKTILENSSFLKKQLCLKSVGILKSCNIKKII